MKIKDIETSRFLLRGFTKEDALWAYSIWNNPEMGQYLPDEAKEEIDDEYLKMLEVLGDDDECCYLIPVFKDSLERVGTCSFMISEDKKIYDIASNRVAQKCGGKIVGENTYKKRGTDIIMKDYKYEIIL